MSSETVLRVENLTVTLRLGDSLFRAVNEISFEIEKGKTLALVGESGCGKSLTALSILKIAPTPPVLPPEGEVYYLKENLVTVKEARMRAIRGAKIAMIFQDPMNSLNPVYTIGNQLIEMATTHLDITLEEAYGKSLEALQAVGISQPEIRMNDYPHQLSGGMNQRVMIAMALLCKPDLLIADEPTTALDVTLQAQIIDLLKDLQEKYHMAILLITHDMGVVSSLAHDVAVMYAGQIIEKGSKEQVFENPSHPYTMGLFASLNREGKRKGELKTIQGSVPSINHLPSGCKFHPRCPFVFEKCYHGEVPSFIVALDPLHTSRCWLKENDGNSTT